MSMKRLMAIAALAVAPLACVANQGDAPIRFLGVRALEIEEGTGCIGSDERSITAGNLDVSGGANYLMAVSVETSTVEPSISIGQEPFSGGGLGDITLSEIIYSYETSAAGLTLPADEADRVSVYAVFRPGTSPDESSLFVRAFGPQALESLQTAVTPGSEPVTVLATIKARGRLSGGQVVESNKFTFPVTVFASGLVYCPAGEIPSGTCGIPGQDVVGCFKPGA
jgi:hypothetical protein